MEKEKKFKKLKASKTLVNDLLLFSNVNGISGREQQVRDTIKNRLKSVSKLKFETDGLGSIGVTRKGTGKGVSISITAHMDEVGFMVVKIEDSGFIRVNAIGGWWSHVLLAQELVITTESGKEYIGIFGSKPPHLIRTVEERNRVLPLYEMFLDIGAENKKMAEKWGIQIGDMVTVKSTARMTANPDFMNGKAMDDRAAVAVGVEAMRRISKTKGIENDVTFIGSAQEEVGLRGARTSSYKWTPDVAICIDTTISNDTPGIEPRDTAIGRGFALSLFDRSVIGNEKLVKKIKDIANKHNIPFTLDNLAAGGTDAGAINLAKEGVPVVTVSIPTRYMHSHNTMISLSDCEALVQFLVKFVKEFNDKDLKYVTNF